MTKISLELESLSPAHQQEILMERLLVEAEKAHVGHDTKKRGELLSLVENLTRGGIENKEKAALEASKLFEADEKAEIEVKAKKSETEENEPKTFGEMSDEEKEELLDLHAKTSKPRSYNESKLGIHPENLSAEEKSRAKELADKMSKSLTPEPEPLPSITPAEFEKQLKSGKLSEAEADELVGRVEWSEK